jgi:hypothetical protein
MAAPKHIKDKTVERTKWPATVTHPLRCVSDMQCQGSPRNVARRMRNMNFP